MFKLLHAAGMRVREASPIHVGWLVPGCDDAFRACYDAGAWKIESKEWSGARWIECDDWFTQIALGGERLKV